MSTERTKCGRLDGDTKPNNVVRAAINHHLPLRPRHRLALGQQQHRCQLRLRPRRLTEQLNARQRTRKTVPAINTSNITAGDANGDGALNAQDYSAILNQILGTPASHNADCNQDGQINVQDLVCINIKINPTLQTAGTTHYAYDEQSQLIGEYDQNGAAIQETIYLGNLPVAVIKQGNLYRLYADHLNTPRAITDTTNKVVWRWQSDAFGTTAANEDADGDGTQFNYNLRFPGQYLDQETGLHYNYFRDYNPHTGRYVQSDPIGLRGGVNTYTYVDNSPMLKIDPTGELGFLVIPGICAGGVCEGIGISIVAWWAAHNSSSIDLPSDNVEPKQCKDDKKDPCEEIKRQIRDIQGKLASKEKQLAKDPYDLYNNAYSTNPGGDLAGRGTYIGHVAQIEGLRIGLARKIEEAKAMGCM